VTFVTVRKVTDEDLYQPWTKPKELSGTSIYLRLRGAGQTVTLQTDVTNPVDVQGSTTHLRARSTGATASIGVAGSQAVVLLTGTAPKVSVSGTSASVEVRGSGSYLHLENTGIGTAQLRVIAAQKIGVVNWSNTPYLVVTKVGDLLPVFTAKQISEIQATAPTELDRTFVLAEKLPPNFKLLLYLRADVYNNAGATSCVRAYFSNATVELCTAATAYQTLTGSAEVTTLTNDWMVLDVSRVDAGTCFVRLACAILMLKAG